MSEVKKSKKVTKAENERRIAEIGKKIEKLGKRHRKRLPGKILEVDDVCKSKDFASIKEADFKMTEKMRSILKIASGPYVKKRKIEQGGSGNSEQGADGNSKGGNDDDEGTTSEMKAVPPYDGGPEILSNERVLRMMDVVKLKHTEAMELLSSIKMWIQMNVPRIEDGNNFRVGVQEECISELSRVEDSSFSVLDSMSKYFATRARLVTKCLKHPNVEDYKRSIEEVDHMQAINLRMCVLDLRNNYTILYDVLKKNDDRLEKPTSNEGVMAMMY